ncbi:hypothetical protein HanIR_Chr14g0701341 [Helianthus annuus]|nr:hypothetical protein HanIR_Chr14g0701341 [Helianthus annuus]
MARRQRQSQDLHETDRQPVQKSAGLERITIRHVTSSTRLGLVASDGTKWIFLLVGQLANNG